MNAYVILKKINSTTPITENAFNQFIKDFQNSFLKNAQYEEKLALHRNPIEVKNQILNDLYSYTKQIQYREEMQDIDSSVQSYVMTKVVDIWRQDKRLRSLYNAVNKYCELRSKKFNTIAVHIAEYRAMNKLITKIQRSISKKNFSKQAKMQNERVKKIRKRIPNENKLRAELQKEINSLCPFCPSTDVGHFHIHHIDNNPSNNIIDNLLLLCPTCHSKITKGDITIEDVVFKKKISGNKDGIGNPTTLFNSEDDFRKELIKLLSDKNSIYYSELKEHWNSYSLINSLPFLNELVNRLLHKSIEFGLLPIISDFVKRHLYYDKEAKYLYNQPHIYIHISEEEGYNLPVFYHIKFIGILYVTAIKNKIDIDSVAHFYKNMQSIFSSMIQGMIDNLQATGIDHTKEYPTNYHWLIAEIFNIENNWLDRFNDEDYFVEASSYLDFIPFNLRLCFSELYKGVHQNKISEEFLVRKYYYGVLSDYLSIAMNDHLRSSIEKNIISEIPNEITKPLFDFCFDEKFAMSYDSFCQGRFRVAHPEETKILTRLRDFLIDNKKI